MRPIAPIVVSVLLATAALAACFVDPNPPNPHVNPEPDSLVVDHDGGGGEEAGR